MQVTPLHPNLRQSDIIGGWKFQNDYVDSCFELFYSFMNRYPIKSCILNPNLQNPPPRNQENFSQLGCSRLTIVAYHEDNLPAEF